MNRRSFAACALLFALGACGGGDDGAAADAAASTNDAPVADARIPDAPPPDANWPDAQNLCRAPTPVTGHHQFVFSSYSIPDSATEANQLAHNIDGDDQGRPDNALGSVLAVLTAQSTVLDADAESDEALNRGALLELVDVEAPALTNAVTITWRQFKGADCELPANPADNLSGDEVLQIAADSPTDTQLSGQISTGQLDLGPGELTVRIAMLGAGPLSLPLIGARITGSIDASGVMNGVIGGAIREEDVEPTLLAPMASGYSMQVDADCTGVAVGCPGDQCRPCGCTRDSVGRAWLDLFDDDDSCSITVADLQNSNLISSLFAPDVDLRDSTNGNVFAPRVDGVRDALSIGFGFTATTVRFDLPPAK